MFRTSIYQILWLIHHLFGDRTGNTWEAHTVATSHTQVSAVDPCRPSGLFAHNEAAGKVQKKPPDLNKEHTKGAAVCMNLFLFTWKGTEWEERAARQHWGMLGRAPFLLPLECPRASYVSPVGPAAAPSAPQSAVTAETQPRDKGSIRIFTPQRTVVKCCNYGLM